MTAQHIYVHIQTQCKVHTRRRRHDACTQNVLCIRKLRQHNRARSFCPRYIFSPFISHSINHRVTNASDKWKSALSFRMYVYYIVLCIYKVYIIKYLYHVIYTSWKLCFCVLYLYIDSSWHQFRSALQCAVKSIASTAGVKLIRNIHPTKDLLCIYSYTHSRASTKIRILKYIRFQSTLFFLT